MEIRKRIAVAALLGLTSGLLCTRIMQVCHQEASDLNSPLRMARALLSHQPIYEPGVEQFYPLTAGLAVLPICWLPPEIAAGVFWGISSALVAFALTRDGYRRLLVFLSCPYWTGLLTVQWSPIFAACAFFPLLMPLTMAKPMGLPVFLTRFSQKGAVACLGFGLLSLAIMPDWPIRWIHNSAGYKHFFPLLVLPFGPLMLLALISYKNRDALLLVLSAAMPQRWFYDQFTLWLIPKSRREVVWTVFPSWGALIWRLSTHAPTVPAVAMVTVTTIYLPMLIVVLARTSLAKSLSARCKELLALGSS